MSSCKVGPNKSCSKPLNFTALTGWQELLGSIEASRTQYACINKLLKITYFVLAALQRQLKAAVIMG